MRGRQWISALLVCANAAILAAQPGRAPEPAAGMFLVARRDLGDPNFERSVVLLLHYDAQGAMGLVVNQQTTLPATRVLEDLPAARQIRDPVFLGGPVERQKVYALVLWKGEIADAQRALEDVYVLRTRQQLEKLLADGADGRTIRVYAGYSGWGPGQLDREMAAGSWRLAPGDAATVFDRDPDTVWMRLIRSTEMLIAGRRAPVPRVLQSGLH